VLTAEDERRARASATIRIIFKFAGEARVEPVADREHQIADRRSRIAVTHRELAEGGW
jgi:hypothetical protein